MISVVMFDLGETLIDADDRPFPNVERALGAIVGFVTAGGKPLRTCLVSDFTMAVPPVTARKVAVIFAAYLARLDASGLRKFFEPVEKRVTLSTHAGAHKPERPIFVKALERLGVTASLERCLFITENAAHIAAARDVLGMSVLQFRPGDADTPGFDDWSDAPALIAARVAPDDLDDLQQALDVKLAGRGIEVTRIAPPDAAGAMQLAARMWQLVSVPGHDDLQDVKVAVPVTGRVTRGPHGELHSAIEPPTDDALGEVRAYVSTLAAQGQIGGRSTRHVPRPTHEIETDRDGNRKLVRRRMSAR